MTTFVCWFEKLSLGSTINTKVKGHESTFGEGPKSPKWKDMKI